MAVDSIPLLGFAEVVPVVVSKCDPHVSTSEPHDVAASCSPDEALVRLCFVSWHTNRRLRDIASEVVTLAANQRGLADQPTPRPYRFTL
jgi:hypothetical protein